jgi:hypothetical protein
LWADRLASADEQGAKFSKLAKGSGEGSYFRPEKISLSIEDYKTEYDPSGLNGAAGAVSRANNAFTESNATDLRTSDARAESTYIGVKEKTDAANATDYSTISPLSRSEFYEKINNGEAVGQYTQARLTQGLVDGITENGWFDGSYEQYLNEFMSEPDYRTIASETGQAKIRDELIN